MIWRNDEGIDLVKDHVVIEKVKVPDYLIVANQSYRMRQWAMMALSR